MLPTLVLASVLAADPLALPGLEGELAELAKSQQLPNLLVGVVRDGKLAWRRSFGPQPVNERTVYRIGSITKVFSALALLHLRDRTARACRR